MLHKRIARQRRRYCHYSWMRAPFLSSNDRRVLAAVRGHVAHLWWVAGDRGIGRRS